ncbi:amidohydrolase [Halomicrobium sp. LC1Hm]|uniref:amidohydrolase family protein n=1 Tax=Halomicrobium sp. LC1Hm TaxID=2610902 RepID=UPI00129838E3|nr:amidohydrolase family protein [Halomicrobium sp. LC1Hm]QGA82217.1 putative metal-dependent hydrolase of the TIM-barrel fold [Halomicrobium sp. LC1Hm]
MLVDTHTHAWGADTAELPWRHPDVTPPGWSGPYTHADLVADMDRADVAEGVVVTTPLYGRGERANEYTRQAIEAHPDRLYGVGLIDFFPDAERPDPAGQLARVVDHDRMLGVRLHAAFEYAAAPTTIDRSGTWFLDDSLAEFWETAGALDTAVFVFPKAQQLRDVARLVQRHPDVTFVIDHMGWPDETTAPDAAPWTDFEALADADNVAVKVSSVPRSSGTSWPYADLHDYLRRLLEWFGPERLMLGSDYPWMDEWADYEACLSWLDAVDCLSWRDEAYLRYRTFHEIHRV